MTLNRLHQQVVVNGVEELGNVHIQYPTEFETSLTCLGYGIGSGAVWTITIRVLVKERFYGRLYEQYRRLLGYTVFNRWYAQGTLAATRLRYLNKPNGIRHVGTRTHSVPQLVEAVAQVLLIVFETDQVNACTAFVLAHPTNPVGEGVRMLTQNCCQTIHEERYVSDSFHLCSEAFNL